jgi:phosphatidate cytidylyltransferase
MDTAIVIFVVAVFAIAAGIFALLQLVQRGARDYGLIWRLYLAQVAIGGFILVPAYLGGIVALLALVVLGLRSQYEFLRLFGRSGRGACEVAAQLLGLAAIISAFYLGPGAAAAAIGTALAVLLAPRLRSRDGASNGAGEAVAAASLLLPVGLVAHLALVLRLEGGFAWLALVYILVECNDSFAYFFGKIFGRHRILPRLSPGKTAEGLAAGVVSAVLLGLILNRVAHGLPLASFFAIALVVLAVGILGDLATSAVKRWRGQKDFPAVLAAHGGVLDIYDSLLVAAPLFHLCLLWLSG